MKPPNAKAKDLSMIRTYQQQVNNHFPTSCCNNVEKCRSHLAFKY